MVLSIVSFVALRHTLTFPTHGTPVPIERPIAAEPFAVTSRAFLSDDSLPVRRPPSIGESELNIPEITKYL